METTKFKATFLGYGNVRLVDYHGTDASVVKAARVSYGKDIDDPEKDAKLIRYLLANKHTSPFEHVSFTFHIKCPIFVARQWMLEQGVSRELARTVLPVSLYTEFYGTVNLHNLLHFLELRLHDHAQPEIREYANQIHDKISYLFPSTFAAWKELRGIT